MTEKTYEGIAILGSHPATVALAPFDDDRWIIYACSPHNFEHRTLPRFDAWFEVHAEAAHQTRAQGYIDYLKTLPVVFMRDHKNMYQFPGAVPFPEKDMDEKFGPYYKQSSISMMQVVAIQQCEDLYAQGKMPDPKIAYFGIMQRGVNEYTYQKATIQNLAIWASHEENRKALGLPVIKQYAPDVSQLWEPVPEVW